MEEETFIATGYLNLLAAFSPSPGVLADVMMLTVVGGETTQERAQGFVSAFLEATDETDPDVLEKELIRPLITIGLSPDEVLTFLLKQDIDLEAALSAFPKEHEPSLRAILASMKEEGYDLDAQSADLITETTQYKIEGVLKALREEGFSASQALDCWQGDELDLSFAVLLEAGFDAASCLDALYKNETMIANAGDVVSAALAQKVPQEGIIAFLKRQDVDPEELDEQLRELEIPLERCTKLLHAYYEAKRAPSDSSAHPVTRK